MLRLAAVVIAEALDSSSSRGRSGSGRPVMRFAEREFAAVRLKARVTKMATSGKQISVTMEHDGKTLDEAYDRALVAVGRKPNCEDLGLENTGVTMTEDGFIQVNEKLQTSDTSLYAIGDVVGGVLLAHKASREARVAVDVIMGESSVFKEIIIPAVVFTDPEIAWCGLTEEEAKTKNIPVEVAKFPWTASGRALSFDRTDGLKAYY
jgi:dihydrolipoamide dehydrogenase